MKFSVITSVLDGADYLADAIASVQRQTWPDVEHVIIDAGSVDGSLDIVKKAMRGDPRIRLYERPGETLYQSVIWGLSHSSGDMLSWLNADDLLPPWSMAAVARFVAADEERQWVSGLPGCWDRNGVLRYVRPEAWRPQALIKHGWFHKDLLGFIQQESVFFSRRLFNSLSEAEKNEIAGARLAGDFMLWKRFARRAPLCTAPTVLGGFRRHGANMSENRMEEYMREVVADGAVFLPSGVRFIARSLHRRLSALEAMRAAEKEDASTFLS